VIKTHFSIFIIFSPPEDNHMSALHMLLTTIQQYYIHKIKYIYWYFDMLTHFVCTLAGWRYYRHGNLHRSVLWAKDCS